MQEEMEDQDSEQSRLNAALGVIIAYTSKFSPVAGDREAVSIIREHMRINPDFWEAAVDIERLVEGKPDWISAILRSEFRRAQREAGDKLEKIRAEREAARLAAIAAERAEMEQLDNFGMF